MKYQVVFVACEFSVVYRGSWTAVVAEYIEDNIFRITNKKPIKYSDNWKAEINSFEYDEDYDDWEFPPESYVKCEWFTDATGPHLRAVEKANSLSFTQT